MGDRWILSDCVASLGQGGNFDFTLMYISTDNVNYETIIKEEGLADERGIMAHVFEKHVIPVSPNCFYAYLQVIAPKRQRPNRGQSRKLILDCLKMGSGMSWFGS